MRLVLALVFAPFAFAQTAADRVVPTPGPPPAEGSLGKLLELIGPVRADEPPHVERFGEFALATVGPVPLLGEAAGAGISQWTNSPPEWGDSSSAFLRRYWTNLAYNGVRQGFTYAGSLALREDTRYFACSCSGFWPRARHAVVSTFTARGMNGKDRFSVSNTGGVIAAAVSQTAWGPPSWQGPGNIAANAGLSFASTAAFNVVREFLPDLFHRSRPR